MYENWVIDTTLTRDKLLCFIPIENIGTPEQTLVTGMNLLTTAQGFKEDNHGKMVGLVHLGGQDDLDEWINEHKDIMEEIEKVFPKKEMK